MFINVHHVWISTIILRLQEQLWLFEPPFLPDDSALLICTGQLATLHSLFSAAVRLKGLNFPLRNRELLDLLMKFTLEGHHFGRSVTRVETPQPFFEGWVGKGVKLYWYC